MAYVGAREYGEKRRVVLLEVAGLAGRVALVTGLGTVNVI
jgi:hypothetical protein